MADLEGLQTLKPGSYSLRSTAMEFCQVYFASEMLMFTPNGTPPSSMQSCITIGPNCPKSDQSLQAKFCTELNIAQKSICRGRKNQLKLPSCIAGCKILPVKEYVLGIGRFLSFSHKFWEIVERFMSFRRDAF